MIPTFIRSYTNPVQRIPVHIQQLVLDNNNNINHTANHTLCIQAQKKMIQLAKLEHNCLNWASIHTKCPIVEAMPYDNDIVDGGIQRL